MRARPVTIAVASGKGGTGKTLVASNLAALMAIRGRKVALVDCDVDAPNAHLFLRRATEDVTLVEAIVAAVEPRACTACGACSEACAFGAIRVLGSTAVVFEELCRGCGVCVSVCAHGAVTDVTRRVGEVRTGAAEIDPKVRVYSGVLDIGQVKTPPVVRAAVEAGTEGSPHRVILDVSPGVACPVVAAVRDADALLLVTEPTSFGIHDLELSLELGREMSLPMAVVVNRVTDGFSELEVVAARWGVPIICQLPFDRRVAEICANGGLVVSELPEAAEWFGPIIDWADAIGARSSSREGCRT